MTLALIVAQPFGTYKIGDEITDPTVVATLLASPNAVRVRKVNVPDPVQPGS